MLEALMFIISFVAAFVGLMMISKTEDGEKLSIIKSMSVCFFTELSLGTVILYAMYKMGILVNMTELSIIYFIIFICSLVYTLKKKRLQKYHLFLQDVLCVGVVLFITMVVFWRIFSFGIKFNYINTDPGTHMSEALKLIRTGKLGKMPFTQIYNAMVIQVFTSIFPTFATYKAFILADTFSNFLSGVFFYTLLSEFVTNKWVKRLIPIITAFYFVGWPLYNYIQGGFVYWGVGACLVMYGLYLINRHYQGKINLKALAALLLLNIISIALCYMMFAPYTVVMYGVLLLQMYWSKIPDKKKLIRISVIALIVTMALVIAFIMIYFHGKIDRMFYWLSYDGGIHRSLYKDLIYFLPFEVIVLFDMRKKKKLNILNVSFLIFTLMVLASLVLELTGIMSSYYYYKLYYILWILGWANTALGLEIVIDEKQKWAVGYISMLVVMFVYSFTPLENWEYDSYGFNATKQSPEFPMYSSVGSFVKNPPENWAYPKEKDFFDLADYVIKMNEAVPVLSGQENGYWYKKFTGSDRCEENKLEDINKDFFESIVSDNKYFCIEKSTDYYKEQKDVLSDNYDIIYEADFGVIYKTK